MWQKSRDWSSSAWLEGLAVTWARRKISVVVENLPTLWLGSTIITHWWLTESPIMHQRGMKKRNTMISPWSHLTKAKSEFSTLCSLCPLPSMYESQSVPAKGCLVNLSPACSVYVCLSVLCVIMSLCVSICVCPSQRPLFYIYWTAQKASHGEGMGTWQKSLTEFYK